MKAKIDLVSIARGARNIPGGCNITFKTDDAVTLDSFFKVDYTENDTTVTHYFETKAISITWDAHLEVVVKETGSYAKLFENKPGFDIRNLLGHFIEEVTDTEVIARIKKAATLC